MSEDNTLSGLPALVADQYFNEPSRPPVLDAWAGRMDPISKLHILQREMKASGILNDPEWQASQAEFLKASEQLSLHGKERNLSGKESFDQRISRSKQHSAPKAIT